MASKVSNSLPAYQRIQNVIRLRLELGELNPGAPLEKLSLFALLEREHSLQLAHADEEIDATAADAKTAELLEIPKGAPLLRIRQIIYSTQGKAVLYVLGLYRSDRHTLRIRRFR